MSRLLAIAAVLLGATALALVSDRPLPRADFRFINKNDVTTLDIQKMSWMQDLRVTRLLFEGLVRNDVFTWEYTVRPAAADRWEVSQDRCVYTFHLRDLARWSNGQPLRAGDFVFSWRRALLPDTASDYSGQFELIKGARDFFLWRQAALEAFNADTAPADRAAAALSLWDESLRRFDATVGLKALDDRTLRVTLERPTPYFLDLCAFAVFYPVYPPLVRQYEHLNPDTGMMETDQGWTKPPAIITNGPFHLTLWRFKRDMRLVKSPTYWNASTLAIDTIAIPSIEDPNAAVLAFRTGAIDWNSDVVARYLPEMVAAKREFYREHQAQYDSLWAQGLDPIEIDRRLPSDPRKNIHVFPAFGTYFLNYNCSAKLPDGRENPFHDPRVRRAFSLVIDKRTIADQIRRIGEPVSPTLIPPGSIGRYTSPRGLPCISDAANPDQAATIVAQAKALLADAGYPDPSNFITVDILFSTDGGHDLICQTVARNWQEHLGVSVTLTQKEVKVAREDLKNKNYIVGRGSWYGDYGDPTTFLDINRTGDGNNDRAYSNPAYDALLDQARDEPDSQRRLDLLTRAEQLILDDAALLPLFTYAAVYNFDAGKITGISSHPRSDQNMFLVDVFNDGKGTDKPLMLPPRPPESSKAAKQQISK